MWSTSPVSPLDPKPGLPKPGFFFYRGRLDGLSDSSADSRSLTPLLAHLEAFEAIVEGDALDSIIDMPRATELASHPSCTSILRALAVSANSSNGSFNFSHLALYAPIMRRSPPFIGTWTHISCSLDLIASASSMPPPRPKRSTSLSGVYCEVTMVALQSL